MKITKTQLRQVVKEELAQLDEFFGPWKKKSLNDWMREIEGFSYDEIRDKLTEWEEEVEPLFQMVPDHMIATVAEVREQWLAKRGIKMTRADALEYFADMMDTMVTVTKRLGGAAERRMDRNARRKHAKLQDKLNREEERAIEAWEKEQDRKAREPKSNVRYGKPYKPLDDLPWRESISHDKLKRLIAEELKAVLESK